MKLIFFLCGALVQLVLWCGIEGSKKIILFATDEISSPSITVKPSQVFKESKKGLRYRFA